MSLSWLSSLYRRVYYQQYAFTKDPRSSVVDVGLLISQAFRKGFSPRGSYA